MKRSTSLALALALATTVAGCAEIDGSRDEIRSLAEGVARVRLAVRAGRGPLELDASGRHRGTSFPKKSACSGDRSVAPASAAFLVAEVPSDLSPEETASPEPDEPHEVERGPLPGFRQTVRRDLEEMPGLLWSDTRRVYTDPLNLVFLLGAGGASAALRPEVDDDIEDYYDRKNSLKSDWRDAFGAAGNPITHFALAGAWYLAGQQAQDAKTYEVGKRALSALTISGVSTVLLKLAANTESPNGEQWAWPSGHVSSSMAMATVMNHAYGPLVGVPLFGLTGLVALERLDSREHHFSDVVFGAALGWVVAETVMKEHRPEIFGGQIAPYMDPAGPSAGIAWVKTLGP